ncbi:MAG: TerC family protein [Armatimonadetes bacterium]|nr:TerC family protein [Armatimonadota bacterium]
MTPLWAGFVVLVVTLLAIDLGVLNRNAKVIGMRQAMAWTVGWMTVAFCFNCFVWLLYDHHWCGAGISGHEKMQGAEAAVKFFTGYLVEQSLSLDNVFVIALIFAYFGVPKENQHRTLFWGIVGAMVMRGIMIGAGIALLHRFEWMIDVFGVLLLLTAAKMWSSADNESVHPDQNPLVRLARRLYPVSPGYDGQRFFTRLEGGRLAMTPLFLVLLVVESTDVLFAVDSIPAIFGVTRDPFLVFSSNIFAILGLRSLFFVLAGALRRFHRMKHSLVLVLAFIGLKMLATNWIEIPVGWSLGTIALILTGGVVLSVWGPPAASDD